MVDGPNMYNYCLSDPVNNTDPMGTKVKIGGKEINYLIGVEVQYVKEGSKISDPWIDKFRKAANGVPNWHAKRPPPAATMKEE